MAMTEPQIRIENREELVFLLTEAAELEHAICCSYLFAAMSLRTGADGGLPDEQAATVRSWQSVIYEVAAQEMAHLALVNNLLTAVGGAPHLRRPNFPQRSRYYPASFQMTLRRFDDEAIRHFLFLERPEGFQLEDGIDHPLSGFAPLIALDDIFATEQEFATVGHLYRGVEHGLHHLARRFGEEGLFIGPPQAQATQDHFKFPELVAVTDLDSAIEAIETIVTEGEGARGDIEHAHFGRFLEIHREFTAAREEQPGFDPAYPVIPNPFARTPVDATDVNLLDDPRTIGISNLFNGCYELMLLLLARYFAHTEETSSELRLLADVSVDLMFVAIRPLGELLSRLPAGPSYPEGTAGPSFHLSRTIHTLPHKTAAWLVFRERIAELAGYAADHMDGGLGSSELQQLHEMLIGLHRKLS